jgi:hypothetical protein
MQCYCILHFSALYDLYAKFYGNSAHKADLETKL